MEVGLVVHSAHLLCTAIVLCSSSHSGGLVLQIRRPSVLGTDIRSMGHAPYAGSMPTTQGGTPPRRVHPRYASYGRFHANTQDQMIRANINSFSSFNAHLILFRGIDLCFDENFGPWLQDVVTQIYLIST